MNNYMNGLIPQPNVNTTAINEDNKIINEAIVLDSLGNNKTLLNDFYNRLGKFGLRDGVLNECCELDDKLNDLNKCSSPEVCAVLATAKECDSSDYVLYNRCLMIMNKCLENMKDKFGNIAKERVDAQKAVVDNNPRIQNALQQTIDAHNANLG